MSLVFPPQGNVASVVGPTSFPLSVPSGTALATFDGTTSLIQDSANQVGIRNGTTGQNWSVYNTYTAGTPDYERLESFWSSNVAVIRTAANGTGTERTLEVRF